MQEIHNLGLRNKEIAEYLFEPWNEIFCCFVEMQSTK